MVIIVVFTLCDEIPHDVQLDAVELNAEPTFITHDSGIMRLSDSVFVDVDNESYDMTTHIVAAKGRCMWVITMKHRFTKATSQHYGATRQDAVDAFRVHKDALK